MREHPILFSAAMIRAILSGAKSQTRRILDPERASVRRFEVRRDYGTAEDNQEVFICPHGAVGDRLWVRETWARTPGEHPSDAGVLYRATDPGWDENDTGLKWKPSIHMPRWASRLTLEVTDVRVERLQEISEADAKAEGVALESDPDDAEFESPDGIDRGAGVGYSSPSSYVQGFSRLWDTINGERASWASNPWVWCVELKRVEQDRRAKK